MALTTDRAESNQFDSSLGKAAKMRSYAKEVGHYNGATELTPECQDGVRDMPAEGVSQVAGYGPSDGTPGLAGSNIGAAEGTEPAGTKSYATPAKTGPKLRGQQP